MSVLANQTNITASNSFFASIDSSGGSASNWSQFPAISTISYSAGGGVANFTNLNVSSINSAAYPPAGGITPIIGILIIAETTTAFETDTITGVTSNSIITGTLTSSSNIGIQTLTAQTDKFYMALTSAAPSATRFYYVIWPSSNSTPTPPVAPGPGFGYPGFPGM